MSEPKYPAGWDEARIKRVLDHHESQTDEESVAEAAPIYGTMIVAGI